MAKIVYFSENSQKIPVENAGHLRRLAADGVVQPDTLIFQEGWPNPYPASKIKGLTFGSPILEIDPDIIENNDEVSDTIAYQIKPGEKIIGIDDKSNDIVSTWASTKEFGTHWLPRVVPDPKCKCMGLKLASHVAEFHGGIFKDDYGSILEWHFSDYSDIKCIVVMYLYNVSEKAVKSATFRVSIVDPSRSVPFSEFDVTSLISGGIEPSEIKTVKAFTLDDFICEIPDSQSGLESRVSITGFSFYDDEEVGIDRLNAHRQ